MRAREGRFFSFLARAAGGAVGAGGWGALMSRRADLVEGRILVYYVVVGSRYDGNIHAVPGWLYDIDILPSKNGTSYFEGHLDPT